MVVKVYNFGYLFCCFVVLYFDGSDVVFFEFGVFVFVGDDEVGYLILVVCYYEDGLIVLVILL